MPTAAATAAAGAKRHTFAAAFMDSQSTSPLNRRGAPGGGSHASCTSASATTWRALATSRE
eukprot:1180027-Prorocentrum_minimum.AAC.1